MKAGAIKQPARLQAQGPMLPSQLLRASRMMPSVKKSSSGLPCQQAPAKELSQRVSVNVARIAVIPRASAAAGAEPADNSSESLMNTLTLGLLFAGWYAANIYFNIYNKQVLAIFAYPLTCTTFQFLVGAGITLATWVTGIMQPPAITGQGLLRILPLAMCHTLGNLLTNMSLGAVAVSFTHTIKASEPFFSVLLSALFLGDRPPLLVLATLVPIVGGVVIASLTEASFNWLGFLTAMGSNLTFQSRNVLSKKLMISKASTPADKINLFGLITILSALLLLPVSLLLEGWKLTPAALSAMGVSEARQGLLVTQLLGAAFTFHLYQQVSYLILSRVSPVTHSIGNCVKRVIVIVASVFFFQNPMSMQNAIGTTIALAGVFAYSQAKRFTGKAKTKAA